MLTDKDINRSLNIVIACSVLFTLFFMTITAGPLALMLEALGASGIMIGVTAMLIQLGMAAQIPAAFYCERLERRKPTWATITIIARIVWIIPGIIMLVSPEAFSSAIWATIIACGIFSFLAQFVAPSWFSWMADLIPDSRRDSYWSVRQGYVMVASLISVVLTGWFLDLFPKKPLDGFAWLLIISTLMGILDIIVHLGVKEPPCTPSNRDLPPWKRIIQPLKNRDFLYFTLAMSLWMFGVGLIGPFINVYLKEAFDVLYLHLAIMQICGMVSGVVASFIAGRLIRSVGIRTFGLSMVVVAPVFHFFWLFLDGSASYNIPILGTMPQPILLLCLGSLLAGGIYANITMLQLNLLTALAPTEGRTMAMAVHWSVVGLISAFGPIAGGWIKDWIMIHPLPLNLPSGTPVSYVQVQLAVHAVLIWAVMLPMFGKMTAKDGEWPVDRAVLHIWILNPLRTVRDLYNINLALGSRAVKRLKNKRTRNG